MRKSLIIALTFVGAFLFAALPVRAQFTTVSATVVDPNGIPYAGGTMSAVLVPSASGGYSLGGQPYSGRVGPVTLDSTGKFTANFGDVTMITPGSPQWQITINSNQGGIEPPLGTGPQTFVFTSSGTTISGSSPVDISAALNALAPNLTTFATVATGTSAESKGASPGASATANQAAIQNALNVTGLVTLSTCGTYNVNGHFVIKSNTRFRIAPCVKLFQANGTNDNLLVNTAYANRGFVNGGTETYVSGVGSTCTPSSTQTVTFNNGNPAVAAIGTISINPSGAPTGTVTIGLPSGTNGGSLYQSAPTTGTITTCTGTATFTGGTITGLGTAVTLTYTSGMTVSVAWTSHGFIVGQYVYLAGSSPTNFDGVFKINSITDANDFVVELTRFPLSGPSGQAVGIGCDQHINVEGGTWDYNGANQTTSSNQLADSFIFGFAQDVTLFRSIVNNSTKYAFLFGAVRDVTTQQIGSDFTLSDEIKVFGSAKDVHLLRTFGRNGDDGISFQPNPAAAGFPQTNFSVGDILNSGVDGVDIDDPGGSSTGAVDFYPDNTYYMGGLYAKNVSGTRDNQCVAISSTSTSALDTIRLENLNCAGTFEVFVLRAVVGTLEIDNETFNGTAASGGVALFAESASTTISNLILTGCNLNNTSIPSSGAVSFLTFSGAVNNFTAKNCLINGSSSVGNPPRFMTWNSGSSPGKITVDSVNQPNGDNFVTLNSGLLTTPTVTVRDSTLGTKAIVSVLGPNANVVLFGNVFANCSNGCIRTTGTPTINLASSDNTLLAGSMITVVSGTPVFTFLKTSDVGAPLFVGDPGPFGSTLIFQTAACETTYGITTANTGSATTTTGLNCVPANAVIDAVVYRITTTITTAANFTVGVTGSLTRYCGTQSTLTAGTTGLCQAQINGGTSFNTSGAVPIVVTFNATPGAGALRLIVYYHLPAAPTA